MKRFYLALFLVVPVLLMLFSGCAKAPTASALVDDAGKEIVLAEMPQRLVSHVPNITEILFALGLGDKVVGVSEYCDYPPEAKTKPSIGGFFDPSMEKIVAQKPDLVFTDGYGNNLTTQLDSLKIPYVTLNPKNLDGIMKDITLVGKLTGTEEQAGQLVNGMQQSLLQTSGKVANAPRVKVFYTYDVTDLSAPWTLGTGSLGDEMITLAGGENVAGKVPDAWIQLSIEELVNAQPDIIIVEAQMGTALVSIDVLAKHPVWSKLAAVKNGKVFTIDGNLVSRPGPRVVQGLDAMARIIHPERFK